MVITVVGHGNERGIVSTETEVWDSGGIVFVDFDDNVLPLVTFLESLKYTDEIEVLGIGVLTTQESKNKELQQNLLDKVTKTIGSVCDEAIELY
jgi:hypothetical protein